VAGRQGKRSAAALIFAKLLASVEEEITAGAAVPSPSFPTIICSGLSAAAQREAIAPTMLCESKRLRTFR